MVVRICFEMTPPKGRAESIRGRAKFQNEGEAPVALYPMLVESPSLALEIVDVEGRPVPLPPPPVPDPSAQPVELAPGESYDVEYPGVFPAWTKPGRYRVRARLIGKAESEWVELTVVARDSSEPNDG